MIKLPGENSPIQSGWKGDINGAIKKTQSTIQVKEISLTLSHRDAWALCNALSKNGLPKHILNQEQIESLLMIGKALARFIDHSNCKEIAEAEKDES